MSYHTVDQAYSIAPIMERRRYYSNAVPLHLPGEYSVRAAVLDPSGLEYRHSHYHSDPIACKNDSQVPLGTRCINGLARREQCNSNGDCSSKMCITEVEHDGHRVGKCAMIQCDPREANCHLYGDRHLLGRPFQNPYANYHVAWSTHGHSARRY